MQDSNLGLSDFKDSLYLHGCIFRQTRDGDGGAGMATAISEDFHEDAELGEALVSCHG